MVLTDFDTEEEYDDNRFTAKTAWKGPRQKTVLGYFKPNQFIPVHAPDSTLTIVVHEGEGLVRDGEDEHSVEPGDVIIVPSGEDRGIYAEESRLKAALVTSPPPTEEEHEKVHRGLKQNLFEP